MGTKNNLLLFLFITTPIYNQLYINEIIADSNEEYNDWIEIYNNSNGPINIVGSPLSDDPFEPTQYTIPTSNTTLTTVPANEYLIFWEDMIWSRLFDTKRGIG